MFKTELHCHSKSISACARVSNEDIIEKFTKAGYTSLVLANHFNKDTQGFLGCAESYQDFVTAYLKGYEDLKKDAEGKGDNENGGNGRGPFDEGLRFAFFDLFFGSENQIGVDHADRIL